LVCHYYYPWRTKKGQTTSMVLPIAHQFSQYATGNIM
jgi:hypothetical protein